MPCGKFEIWNEPVRGGSAPIGLLGLDGMDRLRLGPERLGIPPPIHHLTGLAPTGFGEGSSAFEMPASPWLQTSAGVFPGGVLVMAADAPFGAAIVSSLPRGAFVTTSQLTMNFLRPASPASGTLIGRGRLIHAGRSVALSEATVEDAQGRLLAHGTSRYYVLRIDPPPEPMALEPYRMPVYDSPDPWMRPVVGGVHPEVLSDLGGVEAARRALAGELEPPPIAHLFGMRLIDADEGRATFGMVASEWLHSPARTVYGGCLAVHADTAMIAAISTTLPPRSAAATLDLTLHFLRPAFGDGSELVARADVVHRGKTLAVARAEVVNAAGKTVVMGTSSAMILPDRPWEQALGVVLADEATSEED